MGTVDDYLSGLDSADREAVARVYEIARGEVPDAVAAVASDVGSVEGTGLDKGTIRFQPDRPLPEDVVLALVRFRRDQIGG